MTPHIFRLLSGLPFGLLYPTYREPPHYNEITPAIFKDCGKQKISNFTLFTIYETAHRYNIEAVRFIVENAEKASFVAFHIFGSFQREMFGRIPENVIFHGFAPEKEYKKMLMTADIAVMPLWHQSGINVRIVEYLRYGLPVVGTPWIARGYGFKQGEHFIPFDNGESFIEALEKALDGRHREGIVKNATEHARENLNAKRIAERVGKIIERSA